MTPLSSHPTLGVLAEIQKLLEPLLTEPDLHRAFLEFTKPPNTYQKLQKLTEYVSESAMHPNSASCTVLFD